MRGLGSSGGSIPLNTHRLPESPSDDDHFFYLLLSVPLLPVWNPNQVLERVKDIRMEETRVVFLRSAGIPVGSQT